MITDWVIAICILFLLHYIMLFITTITQKITEMLNINLIGKNGQDIFLTSIRTQIETTPNFNNIFGILIIYIVLVIFTVMFTIQYLKRFVYLAFFTIIAPLIALTYPLDKIKDGQAQAFSIWLKEYTFNTLIQPVHLLLYYIFVDSALELAITNPIYVLVTIGFMIPAERFFRKMFGFDKAQSASPIAAAAGGAAVMNGINSIKNVAGKGSSNKAQSSTENSAPRYAAQPGTLPGGTSTKATSTKATSTNRTSGKGSSTGGTSAGGTSTKWGQQIDPAQYGKRNIKNGAKTLAKTNGKRILTGTGKLAKRIASGAVGLAGAATLGTVGLAAGIATGDASKAFTYGLAGLGAGFASGNAVGNTAIGLGEKAVAFEKQNREMYKEGALGTEEYNTRNTIKELNKDSGFNNACKDLNITDPQEKEELIRHFYSNGIQDPEEIKKALNIRTKTGASQKEIIAAQKIRNLARSYGMKRKDIEELLISNGVEQNSDEFNRAMDIMDQL